MSDGVVAGTRDDRSGASPRRSSRAAGFEVVERRVVADGVEAVAAALRELAAGFAGLIVTTGGTGFGPRDLTPEGTRAVLERRGARAWPRRCVWSARSAGCPRQLAGTVGSALVLNLPGSPNGVRECLEAVLDVVPHALDLLAGGRPH